MPTCSKCHKEIVFLKTAKGKFMPVNADTVEKGDTLYEHGKHISHFSDCPAANQFRDKQLVVCKCGSDKTHIVPVDNQNIAKIVCSSCNSFVDWIGKSENINGKTYKQYRVKSA